MRRKTVLYKHTVDTFTPKAESGQFRPLGLGRARDWLTIFCKIPSSSIHRDNSDETYQEMYPQQMMNLSTGIFSYITVYNRNCFM